MATGGAIAALAVSAIGTGVSVSQQRKAQRAEEKRDAVGEAQAQLENQRNIRQAIAASRLQQAQVQAAGQASGGTGSSGLAGGLGSAQTQVASNIGFARQTAAANSAINRQTGLASQALAAGATAQAIGGLPAQFGFDPKSSAKVLAEKFGK